MEYEWAIRVEKAEDLPIFPGQLGGYEPASDSPWEHLRAELDHLLVCRFGRPCLARLYFGSEFCQHLIPSLNELQRAWETGRWRKMAFTLVTPFVTDLGLSRLVPLFDFLARLEDPVEVVFNDWGVLRLLRCRYPDLRPILGRLLCKALRDPRLADPSVVEQYAPRGQAFLRDSSVAEGRYGHFLQDLGVGLVSLDWLAQGWQSGLFEGALECAVHLPFSHVASGRTCLLASLHLPKGRKFLPVERCGRECRGYVLELQHDTVPTRLFQRGNSVVMLHTERMLEEIRQWAAEWKVRRLVYEWA